MRKVYLFRVTFMVQFRSEQEVPKDVTIAYHSNDLTEDDYAVIKRAAMDELCSTFVKGWTINRFCLCLFQGIATLIE